MNKYDESGGDDEQSEDGQLSPEDDIDSHEEGDTADSLDIKPPQANRIDSNRYNNKEKKTSKEKKHSRDRRHRERERGVGVGGGGGEQHDRRRRHRTDNRYHGFSGGRPGVPVSGKAEREIGRYEQPPIRDPREREHYRGGPKDREKDKFRADRDKERDRERRKDSPEKSDADRMLEDLRSRLLSKRSKFESDKRHDDRIPQGLEYENRRIEKEINRYEYESRREKEADRRNQYYHRENREHYRERKQMVELIDSPENYGDNQPMNHKIYKDNRHSRQMTIEDKEQAARRAKLIEADREMARRKELAREELEARRELRRERDETKTSSESPDLPKKRRLSSEEEEMKNIIVEVENIDQNVVMVSDNSEDDTESEYGSSSHTEEEREEEYESKDEVSDGELPGSPLSIGELTKSDIRHASRSGSISSRSQSRSKSRSLSKSKSQSPQSRSVSRSPRNRSKSKTPENDENKEQPKQEEEVPVKVEEKPEEKEELPPYFPAAQGCRSVEEFQCLNRIEEGTYGVVYRAKDKRTDEIVALKRLKMEKEKEGFPITSLREINTLLKGQHPNIVTVREIVVGSNMDKIFIVMDYVEHDLKSLMETMKYKKQVFLPGEVKCLTQQLLRAVAHLHDNWILHRDLKTSNLLLSHKGILKVGDFGLAREYGSPLKAYTSIVVTLWYRAPELLLCCKEYSIPIDMWSVGCIFAEFLAMNALFPGKSEIDQLNRIFKDLGTPNERIWPGYNELPAVQKMTFTEYPVSNLRKKFSHFTSEIGLSLLQGLLTYDPKQRLTAEQALKSSYFKELPLPIDPAMFPTWPAKSEIGLFKALSTNIKPPSGGDEFKKLAEFENREEQRWGASMMAESRQMAMGPGFSLKF